MPETVALSSQRIEVQEDDPSAYWTLASPKAHFSSTAWKKFYEGNMA